MNLNYVLQDFYIDLEGNRTYYWTLLVELHNGIIHYKKKSNELYINNSKYPSEEFQKNYLTHPDTKIVFGFPKVNGCHCMIISYHIADTDGEKQYSLCHFLPTQVDFSSNEYTPSCYEDLLAKIPEHSAIDVVLIGMYNKNMFNKATSKLKITINTFRKINHHYYYNLDCSFISKTTIKISGDNWNIENKNRIEPRSVFINYVVDEDSIVLYGDELKKTNMPSMHIARNVFIDKHMVLLFQTVIVNIKGNEINKNYKDFKSILPLFQKKLYENVELCFYMKYCEFPKVLNNKNIDIQTAMIAEFECKYSMISETDSTNSIVEKIVSLVVNKWDNKNYQSVLSTIK